MSTDTATLLTLSYRPGRRITTCSLAGRHRVRRPVETRRGIFLQLKCGHCVHEESLVASTDHDCVACEIVHAAELTEPSR